MDLGLHEHGNARHHYHHHDDNDNDDITDNNDLFSGLTSGFNDEEEWPGDESEESDVDEEETRRRLLPLRKIANKKPVVLLELSDMESLRSEGPTKMFEEVTLDDVEDSDDDDDDDDDDLTGTISELTMTLGEEKAKEERKKRRRRRTAEMRLNAIFNTASLHDRIYSYLPDEASYAHRRICRSFRRRFTNHKVKVRVHKCLPQFIRYASQLQAPLPASVRFAIDGLLSQEELGLLGKVISANMVPGLEDIAIQTDVETDNRHFTTFFQHCEAAPRDPGTTNIQSLDLAGCYLGDDTVRGLLQSLRKGCFPRLHTLRLARCNLTWLTAKYLTETLAIRLRPPPTTGTHKEASSSSSSSVVSSSSSSFWSKAASSKGATEGPAVPCDPITTIDLSRNTLSESLCYLFHSPPPTPHLHRCLTQLHLSDCSLVPTDLHPPLTDALSRLRLRSLTTLMLHNNSTAGDVATSAVLHALATQPKACPCLTHLNLSDTGSANLLASSLASALRAGALPQLQHLDLSFNLLSHDGTSLLCEAMKQQCCPQLTYLSLACNRIKDAGVHHMSRTLAMGAGASLTALDLSINEVSGSVQNLARVVNSLACPDLKHLRLSGNIFSIDIITTLFTARVRRKVNIS